MNLATSTDSCVKCSLKLNLDWIYVHSLDFTRANSDHMLAGHCGDHRCSTCGSDFHDNEIGSKIAYAIEHGRRIDFCCIACFQAFQLADANYAAFRQIIDIVKASRLERAA